MKVLRLEKNVHPMMTDKVRVKDCGRTLELMYAKYRNKTCNIIRLDNDHYVDKKSGEVKEISHIENRAEDKNGVRISLGKLRDLLNTNIDDVDFCRWVTVTYAENMTDTKRLEEDFEAFNRRMRKQVGHYEYIACAEPQGRGAWHMHFVMLFDHKAPYIANERLREAWKQGFVTVKRLDNVDNVGAYLTAYLGDMEMNEAVDLGICPDCYETKIVDYFDDNGQPTRKAILKGARLHLYPPKFNLFRSSRGIKKPDIYYDNAVKAQKKASAGTLTYEKTVMLSDGAGFENTLNYRNYNMVTRL